MGNDCIVCGLPRTKGRRYCKACYAKRRSELRGGKQKRHNYGASKCSSCGKEITLWRKNQKWCHECSAKGTSAFGNVSNQYATAGGEGYSFLHRRVVERILGRKLLSYEYVHHLDEDPNHSAPDNLIVITRGRHASLHAFLRRARAILNESKGENAENCWNTLRALLTTTWLETTGAKIIKIAEAGQSAADPLLGDELETLSDASKTDEDMVRAVIAKTGY